MGLGIRRMLLAVEPSSHELLGLDAAARLAASADIELAGLLVEDEQLCRFAEAVGVRVVGPFSPSGHAMDEAAMNASLRAFAQRMQRALAQSAAKAGARFSFRTVRGHLPREVMRAAEPLDLIVTAAGRGAIAIASGAQSSVLVLRAPLRERTPKVVVYGPSKASEKALLAASELSRAPQQAGESMTVLLVNEEPSTLAQRRGRAEQLLGARGIRAQYKTLREIDSAALSAIAEQYAAMLILDPNELGEEEMRALLQSARFPVMVVR